MPKALPMVDISAPICCAPVSAAPLDDDTALEIALRLKALADPGDRPRWEAGRRRLVWPDTGSAAYAFSAEDPDSLRGPQFHGAWADEFCAWREPEAVLSNLRFGLRLGNDPKLAVTTTPRPIPALRRLMAEAEDWLFGQGWDQIWLATGGDESLRALGFYGHLGWVPAGVLDDGQIRFVKRQPGPLMPG